MAKIRSLRDYQREINDNIALSLEEGIQRQLVILITGGGKCHPAGTEVLMYNGTYKDVSEIQVGDQLMGPDSKPRNVLSLGQGREECYLIKPIKGDAWKCNESHILSLVCNQKQHTTYNEIINISVKDYLQKTDGFKHVHKLYRTSVKFSKKPQPLDPYFLGIWLGDGTKRSSDITNTDKEIINWLYNFAQKQGLTLKKKKYKNRCPVYAFQDPNSSPNNSHKLTELLNALQVLNNKHIPHVYKTGSTFQRLQLLAGLLDSDGHLKHHKSGFEIVQQRMTLAKDIQYLARSLGFLAELSEKQINGQIYYRLHIHGDVDTIPCKIKRKQANPRKQIKNHLRSGFKVEPIGKEKYYGFQLDGDHLYLLKDFTVTHNTVLSAYLHQEIYPNKPTLFIVDRIELAQQARDTFKNIYPNASVGVEMNTSRATPKDDIVILSIDTWGRAGNKRIKRFDPDHFGLLITDEAHGTPTPRYERVLNYFGVSDENLKPDRLLLGITATAKRPDGVGLHKVFDDITANKGLVWGIQNGWVVEPVWYPVETHVDLSEVKSRGREFDEKDLSLRINIASRNEQIVKGYQKFSDGKRSLAFTGSVAHAYELAEVFQGYGINAVAVDANTPKAKRKEYIQKFRDGIIKVLVNFGIYVFGFDETELDSILMARPIKSDLLYRQIIGRAMRPSKSALVDFCHSKEQRLRAIENSRKPYCKIIDFVDSYGKHDVMNAPQLFGLHEKVEAQGKRLYKDVYEPMKDAQVKHGIDISQLTSLDQIELKVKQRQRITIRSLDTPKDIKKMSNYTWIEIGKDEYELSLYEDNVALIVKVNKIDRYDVFEVDLETGEENKLSKQGFASLDGAVNIADQYAEQNYSLKYSKHNARWRKYGVTEKQFKLIKQIFSPEIKDQIIEFDEVSEYTDTEVPFVYIHKNLDPEQPKIRLNRGSAKELLSNFFTNKKKKAVT